MRFLGHLFLLVFLNSCFESNRSPAQQLTDQDGEPLREDSTIYGWKLTFQDEFDGKIKSVERGDNPDCFGGPLTCLYHTWKTKDCKPEHDHIGLKDLNRCNWVVWGMYNGMDWQVPEGKGVNSFNPLQVEVKDGLLYLHAVRSQVPLDQINCKNPYHDPDYNNEQLHTRDCLANSGGVQSDNFLRNGREVGFAQEYGRFEVRAKLSFGIGSWPAIWMLPAFHPVDDEEKDCGWWPYRGEIDLVEAWEKNPEHVSVTYHDGNCKKSIKTQSDKEVKVKDIFREMDKEKRKHTFYRDFHNYAVEWNPNSISFYIDEHLVHTISDQVMIDGKHFGRNRNGEKAGLIRSEIARGNFFMILNNTVQSKTEDRWAKLNMGESGGPDSTHIIDYFRAYKRCTKDDDPKNCHHFKINRNNNYEPLKQDFSVELNVYPNPITTSDGYLNVRLTSTRTCENSAIEILDMLGNKIFEKNLGQIIEKQNYLESININMINLKPALYLLRSTYTSCPNPENKGQTSFKFIVIY